MSVAELPIQIDREQIARFCRERGIRKLSLFGSVNWEAEKLYGVEGLGPFDEF